MGETIKTYIVDSFTNEPFKGNPAGVCILDGVLQENQMQSIAKELGFSETAFVLKDQKQYLIRFFSPKMEIPLCGHATLASSKIIFDINPGITEIHFRNAQGLDLFISKEGESIEMEFPVYHTVPQAAPQELLAALGIDDIKNSTYNKETNILMLEIESSEVLSQLSPNFEQLKQSHNLINGVLVTAISKRANYDFESRYFWPWSGTNEDPVTGGTHTFLAPYWSTRLNKSKMNAYQCSERTGFMEVTLIGNEKMTIKSEAQIIFKGEITI